MTATATTAEQCDPLVLDLVEWVAMEPRSYGDVIAAWRTSCPRLTVWEDAMDLGLLERRATQGEPVRVWATEAGLALLARSGRWKTA
jgi:hypothetical protein